MEVGGEEVAVEVVDGLAGVAAEEVGDMTEVAEAAGMQQGVVAKGGHVEDEDVVIVVAMVGHDLRDDFRYGGSVAEDDTVAVVDVADGNFGFRNFALIFFFPVH